MVLGCREILEGTGHENGRILLEQMYRAYRGTPMPEIRTTDRGKPYFAGDSLHFSITHTPRRVFCALSETPVGIDAEETDRRIRPALADKILSPRERERFLQEADPQWALLRLWVLKEARAKLLGTGLSGYPNDTDFSPRDPRIREQSGCFLAVLEAP